MNADTGSEAITAVEKLERQNEKLRAEYKELSAQLEASKKKYKNVRVPQVSELNEDRETVTVNSKINNYKQEILRMKKELEGNLNISKITDLENQSAFLSKRIEELESEHLSLKKIEKQQQKALDSAHQSNTYPDKIGKLKEDIRQAKENYRELVKKQKEDEKIHKVQHEKCVDLEDKCRKLYDQIKKRKSEEEEKKKSENEMPEITEATILDLESRIKEAETRGAEDEKKMRNKIKELEIQVRESKHNLDMLKIKLKEKDQECRLSALKIKELRKAMKHNQLRPLPRNTGNISPKNPKGLEKDLEEAYDAPEEPDYSDKDYKDNKKFVPEKEKRNQESSDREKKQNEALEYEHFEKEKQIKKENKVILDIEGKDKDRKIPQKKEPKKKEYDDDFIEDEIDGQYEEEIDEKPPKKQEFSKPNFNF